jgi:hypothetical protein
MTTLTTAQAQLIQAEVLGTQAAINGTYAAALCPGFMTMTEGYKIGKTPKGKASFIAIATAWNKGNSAQRNKQIEAELVASGFYDC